MSSDSRLPVRRSAHAAAAVGESRGWTPTGRNVQAGRPAEPALHLIGATLRRRRWTILIGTAAVLAAVAVLTFYWPKTYTSSATFLIEKQGGHTDSPALDVIERLGASGQIQTEINLLSSRSVIEPVVADLGLHVTVFADWVEQRPSAVFADFVAERAVQAGEYRLEPGSSHSYQVREVPGDRLVAVVSPDSLTHFAGIGLRVPERSAYSDLRIRARAFPRAVEEVQGRITVSLVNREADLIALGCKGSTPITAQQLCEGISQSYLRLRTDLHRIEASATAAFLRDQVGRLGEQLTVVEDSVEAYARRHQAVALDERAALETQQDVQVAAQRDQLEAEHSALQHLIRGIDSTPGGERRFRDLAGFPTLLKNEAVTGLFASLNDLENRRADLALRRTEQNADLMAVDERIADIEHTLRAIATSYEHGLALQIKSLDATQDELSRRLSGIPAEQVRTARLQREKAGIEEVYRMLRTRLQEAEVAAALTLPSARIVDAASLPFRPSWPRVPLHLALGLVMGLGFGFTLAVLRELRDSRLHESNEVERTAGVPILTTIPRLRRPGPVLPASTSALTSPRRDRRSAWVIEDSQRTLEAFRALAVDLKFAGRRLDDGRPLAIAVTSAAPGEGKTLTACNLALTRASHGVRTLLIDADIRANGVAAFFRSPTPNYGLSDLLAGAADLPTVCPRLWVEGRPTLSVIPAGSPTPHSAELLESSNMAWLLEVGKARHDLIVIDTPSLNATTDAATIAAIVDGVILVVREGVTDRAALESTLQRLARVNGRVLGVVFNDVRPSGGARDRQPYAGASGAGGFR